MNQTSALDPADYGIESLFAANSNTFFDGLLTFGLDGRVQFARLGRPPGMPPRKAIPMQAAPYLGVSLFEGEVQAYATYNAGPQRFPGQESFEGAVIYQPDILGPLLRVGYFQPAIGLRYDDHTMFTRRNAPATTYIIPPAFAEAGAEISYEGSHWISTGLGVFAAHNLAEADPTVSKEKPTISGRFMVWPQLLDEGINGELGATALLNGDFRMVNLFAGVGVADVATLSGEVLLSKNAADRSILNVTTQGSWQVWPWLSFEARYEHGTTSIPNNPDAKAELVVVGAQFFPLPYLEIRPEYRLFTKQGDYRLGQYTLQFHAFY